MSDPQQLLDERLPADMRSLEQLEAWTADLQSTLLACLISGDQLTVRDFLETLLDGPIKAVSLPRQVDRLIARYSPSDIYDAWQTSYQWARAVQHATLADVIGDERAWTPDLTLDVSYWLLEHATDEQVAQLAVSTGHPKVMSGDAVYGSADTETITYALAELVSPNQLCVAWQKVVTPPSRARRHHRHRPLSRTQTNELAERWASVRKLSRARRWHSREGRELRESLVRLRAAGARPQALAGILGVTRARVYQLTSIAPSNTKSKTTAPRRFHGDIASDGGH